MHHVDYTALRVNQTAVVLLTAAAFVLDAPLLTAVLAAVLLFSSAFPAFAPFSLLYRHLLRPAGLLRPDLRDDSAAPHRFAQLLGGLMLTAAAVALSSGAVLLGWLLAAVVTALALTNLLSGFCAGCFLYFQLSRLRSRRAV
jgi:hypothetical protein